MSMEKQNEIKVFEDKKVRTPWDEDQEKWYFSVADTEQLFRHSVYSLSELKKENEIIEYKFELPLL